MNIIVYIFAGLVSGAIAGMGMGGGTILIPCLILILNMNQHAAQGVNMIAFIPGAIAALYIHHKSGNLSLKGNMSIIISGLIGAAVGAIVASMLEADWLKWLYGGFLIILSIIQFTNGEKKHKETSCD